MENDFSLNKKKNYQKVHSLKLTLEPYIPELL